MKTLFLSLTLLVAVSVRAQLPTASPKAAGFDPARLEVLQMPFTSSSPVS